ncbi:MAG: hypothetical protein LBM69_03240 [Lachnospiraceae bacterium]|jgi:hypothetical protein|nr:hypothetical protein [Lachnospiraceae bacterium]
MRKEKTKDSEFSYLILGMIGVLLLVAVCIPLLLLARYAYPVADDYSFSADVYHVLQEGGNLFLILYAAIRRTAIYWMTWQGSFVAIFFFMFQPGIFGEAVYGIGTWILIGGLLLSQWIFLSWLICDLGHQKRRMCVLLWSFLCIMQLLFMPTPVEALFWFNGSLYYTFFYSLALCYLVILGKLLLSDSRSIGLLSVGMVLGFCIGGGNLATALSVFSIEILIVVISFIMRKRQNPLIQIAAIRLPIICHCVALFLNVIAPGNAVRQNMLQDHASPLWAILYSLQQAFLYLLQWTDYKAVIVALLIIPILWKVVAQTTFSYRLPGLFLLLSFGIYASQFTAVAYAYGLEAQAPKRMENIWWESYWIFLIVCEMYVLGWIYRHREGFKQRIMRGRLSSLWHHVKDKSFRFSLGYSLLLLLLVCLLTPVSATTSYEAYLEIQSGEAAAYARVWQQRLDILRTDTPDVFLPKMEVTPKLLYYSDIEVNPEYWNNATLATYFGKRSVHRLP